MKIKGRCGALTLPIKKKWFDMILSGEKKEEYREINNYYDSRFPERWIMSDKKVKFRNGYSSKSPYFIALVSIKTGYGLPEWGAEPGKEYFVLTIKEILEVRKEAEK